MTIVEFLESDEGKKLSRAEWSRRIGVTRGYLTQLAGGHKVPSLHLAVRIDEITGGKVTPYDWL